MQHLLVDREEDGEGFTWLNRWRVWSLAFGLTWQPHGGGGSGLTLADAERMPLGKAVAWHRWIIEAREREARAINQAREDARRANGRR